MGNTQTISLWLNNEEGSYNQVFEAAQEALQEACERGSHLSVARSEAARMLAGVIESLVTEGTPACDGLWGDLVSSIYDTIDFREVANEFLEDLPVWAVYSSEAEDAKLFTAEEDMREYLMTLVPGRLASDEMEDCIDSLQPGQSLTMGFVSYTFAEDAAKKCGVSSNDWLEGCIRSEKNP